MLAQWLTYDSFLNVNGYCFYNIEKHQKKIHSNMVEA